MNKFFVAVDMMMEMCMCICSMCMIFHASISDMFSVVERKHCTA